MTAKDQFAWENANFLYGHINHQVNRAPTLKIPGLKLSQSSQATLSQESRGEEETVPEVEAGGGPSTCK